MHKPQFLCKLLRNINEREPIRANPESPLLINNNSKSLKFDLAISLFDESSPESEENLYIKDSSTDKLSGEGQESNGKRYMNYGVKKYESNKLPFRRAITVPSNSPDRCTKTYQNSKTEVVPALMIRELKLHSLGNAAQQPIQVGKKLEQIEIRLSWMPARKRISHQAVLTNRVDLIRKVIFDQKEENLLVPSKTYNNFLKKNQKIQKFRSVKKGPFKITSLQQQTKRQFQRPKMLSLSCSKPFLPPPKVTAKSFIVYKTSTTENLPQIMISQNSKNRQEIASLTKVMTAILVIEICRLNSIDIYAEEMTVSTFEEGIPGTTASIRQGEVYTIEQLLHGLMLPSGNDASVTLAVWGGLQLLSQVSQPQQDAGQEECREIGYKRFIKEMNAKARQLKMRKTCYMNSHGLVNSQGKSCAFDVALLCDYCMKNQTFRNIVSCPKYISSIKSNSQPERRQGRRGSPFDKNIRVEWKNTHELVCRFPEQYLGIKTGFTYTAGPCLASCLKVDGIEFLIIVLGCQSMSMRFRDTEVLKKWIGWHAGRERGVRWGNGLAGNLDY